MRTRLSYAVSLALLLCATPLMAQQLMALDDEIELYSHLDRYERRRYEGLRYLMNDHQKMHYLTIPTRKERDDWVVRFWRLNDPTPATRKNERRIEHKERVAEALEMYPKVEFPYWDHRGETLIRFGKPDIIAEIPANVGFGAQFGHGQTRDIKMPGQVWQYMKLGMVVPFEDINLSGEHIYYLEVRTAYTKRPYEMLVEGYNDALDALTYSSSNVYSLFFAASDELMAFYSHLENNRHFHTADLARVPLPCYFDITAFKGGPGKVRTEVNFEIPARELSYEKGPQGFRTDFEVRVAVYDLNMEEVVSGYDLVDIDLPERPAPDSPWLLPAQFILTLDPGYYRFGLEVRDRRTRKHGAFLASRNIAPMGDTLCVSDIQLASLIEKAGSRTSFLKGPLRVIPHPVHAYRKPDPVRFYFEIYGLDLDDEDFGFWEIEYSVEPKEKRREGPVYKDVGTVMSSRFNASGFGSTQHERLEIDSKELWEGSFRLRVRVMDRRTRKYVETQTSFSILE
ncbi:MAG: GWxTD domain-containing protein [Candidatus Krumholzibacteria bacterium]|nr:GWxTD domain-containing protein [Candidatus Krumholzibacteria bacterium]